MKNTKKILVTLLTVVATFLLVACGGSESADGQDALARIRRNISYL